MATKGHVYAANEIRVKIHNLTNKYRDKRKSIGPSGCRPSTWEFYPKKKYPRELNKRAQFTKL
ncbi:PREDICTED: uncharacterized protein LOC108974272 [Bactrocera latifrons]|uniref:uncharacterized protein LOC108974272 n=1 Tax=Bactrocera latifrons TaxID=174628 RepID=UPI0008DC9127|nr:PREDICTED: uncharacterized protein LOC108974272 [Bactrocera latifrons]